MPKKKKSEENQESLFNEESETKAENILSVGEYLNLLNSNLKNFRGRIKGEVCNLQLYDGRSYLYFSIKDKEDQSTIKCFMWKTNYKISGVELQDGLEIVIDGFPNIYKPTGSMTMQVETIELVGEGALKKAYDKLKAKLENEGIFSSEKKKMIPDYPQNIGIITSKSGAVISDFLTNIGRFGFKLKFIDSRVEGQIAIKDLLASVRTFKKQDIDVLVIMRGGGSLESFQAFNNEMLVREISDFPVPVIAGLGHEKDVPLVALAADKMVSTPTAVAELLNKSWQHALAKIEIAERDIFGRYGDLLSEIRLRLVQSAGTFKEKFDHIFESFRESTNVIKQNLYRLEEAIKNKKNNLAIIAKNIFQSFENAISSTKKNLENFGRELAFKNPERQLRLGYSIVMKDGKIVKNTVGLMEGEMVDLKMSDGKVESQIKKIIKDNKKYYG
jgi:exodeoxyribonuclease VII large subunit